MFGAHVIVTNQMGDVALDGEYAQGADIDFRGKQVPASHMALALLHSGTRVLAWASGFRSSGWQCNSFLVLFCTGLRTLHIHDATIEFSDDFLPVVADQTCSTVRLSNITFIVSSGVQKYLNSPDQSKGQHALMAAIGRNSTLTMQNCVLKTAFDAPPLFNLVACRSAEEAQVRLFTILLQTLPC
jgi:hypothetical protein